MPKPRQRWSAVTDLLLTFVRYSWLVLGLAVLVAFAIAASVLRQGRVYASESAFVLDTDRPIGSVSGIAAQFGIELPRNNDAQSPAFYADLLRSPTILRAVIDSAIPVPGAAGRTLPLRLADSIPAEGANPALRRYYAVQRLRDNIGVSTDQRTGVVTLRVLASTPSVALAVNRRMLDLLNDFNLSRRRTRASQQREFIESRLAQAQGELRTAEERLRQFLDANRGYVPSSEASFERQRLEREVSTRSQVYLSLMQSYEQAKVEEVSSAPLLAVIETPELPVGPEPRRLVRKTAVGFLIGAIVGLFVAYLIETIRRARSEHPQEAAAITRALVDLRRNFFRPWRLFRRDGEATT